MARDCYKSPGQFFGTNEESGSVDFLSDSSEQDFQFTKKTFIKVEVSGTQRLGRVLLK